MFSMLSHVVDAMSHFFNAKSHFQCSVVLSHQVTFQSYYQCYSRLLFYCMCNLSSSCTTMWHRGEGRMVFTYFVVRVVSHVLPRQCPNRRCCAGCRTSCFSPWLLSKKNHPFMGHNSLLATVCPLTRPNRLTIL